MDTYVPRFQRKEQENAVSICILHVIAALKRDFEYTGGNFVSNSPPSMITIEYNLRVFIRIKFSQGIVNMRRALTLFS